MTTSEPGAQEPLDFDSAESGSATVACAACGRQVTDEYWTAGQVVVCSGCRERVEAGQEVSGALVSRAGRLSRALLYGTGGMLTGAAVWYAVAKLANIEAGLIAILLGWLVGKAVLAGSGGRGGRRYQVLAALLTYLGIGVAYVPFAWEEMGKKEPTPAWSATTSAPEHQDADTASAGQAPVTGTEVGGNPAGSDSPAEEPAGGISAILLGVGALLLLTLSLPVVVTVGGFPGSIIGLLIYGFAVMQAWQMTRAVRVAFTGPFRVGGPGAA